MYTISICHIYPNKAGKTKTLQPSWFINVTPSINLHISQNCFAPSNLGSINKSKNKGYRDATATFIIYIVSRE